MSSLKLSLVLGAALWSILTLSAAGAAITFIFSITVQRDQMEDLGAALDRLTTELLQDQPVIERALNDPRYEVPGGGLYYQVQEVESGEVLRSRSLWDSELDLPVPPAGGEALVERTGPEGQVLTKLVRDVEIVPNSGDRDAHHASRAGIGHDLHIADQHGQHLAFGPGALDQGVTTRGRDG